MAARGITELRINRSTVSTQNTGVRQTWLRIGLNFRLRVMIGPRTDRVYIILKPSNIIRTFSYFATNGIYGKDVVFNSGSSFLLWIFYLRRSTGLTYVKSANITELYKKCKNIFTVIYIYIYIYNNI